MKVELVVFDMSGTTVVDGDDVHRFLQGALEKQGFHFSREEVNQVMGYPKPLAIQRLLLNRTSSPSVTGESNVQKIHKDFLDGMIHYYSQPGNAKEIPGTSEVFMRLKQLGIKVGIDTGFSRPIAQVIIDQLGWEKKRLIDVSITSDEVPRGRPFPDMIFKVMRHLNITDASKVAKVGDTLSDLEEGNNAGCRWVIGVTTGAFTESELSAASHTHLIKSLDQLFEIFSLPDKAVRVKL